MRGQLRATKAKSWVGRGVGKEQKVTMTRHL
jgi:hypothetical protein